MSRRRQAGERVWKQPYAGFVVEPAPVTLMGQPSPCLLDCGDPECQEWPDARTDDGSYAHHVSECEVLDASDDR